MSNLTSLAHTWLESQIWAQRRSDWLPNATNLLFPEYMLVHFCSAFKTVLKFDLKNVIWANLTNFGSKSDFLIQGYNSFIDIDTFPRPSIIILIKMYYKLFQNVRQFSHLLSIRPNLSPKLGPLLIKSNVNKRVIFVLHLLLAIKRKTLNRDIWGSLRVRGIF